MVEKTYQQEKGDFVATATTWNTDNFVSGMCPTKYKRTPIPPYSEIRVISKNKIFVMLNGSLERKVRGGFELTVSGIGNIFPEHDQVLAVLAKSKNEIKNLPISCIVNENGLTIEHDEIETDWYRIEGFLETIDYPAFHNFAEDKP